MEHQSGCQISPRKPPAITPFIPTVLSYIRGISPMNSLEILRESIRILRAKPSTFMSVFAFLILPFSSAYLSNFLFSLSSVASLGHRLVFLAVTSGLAPSHFLKQICQHLAGTVISSVFCFPLSITFLLLARACVAYSVALSYAGKKVLIAEFKGFVGLILRPLILTYICNCAVIMSCLTLFIMIIVSVCNSFSALGYPPGIIMYPALLVLLGFSMTYTYIMVICNLAGVISIFEEACGLQALLRSIRLVMGKMQYGLLIFLATAICLAFVEGLFEHRVKTLSYGDGSSRIWEWPLLVFMHSFVVLLDYMMSIIFYFVCRSSNIDGNEQILEELENLSSELTISE